ncbi:hypothetical protein NC653_039428 [Populus alba x Populus x berolinensis]|uniref:Uncharacterized protein n=1 Tax=Populus alba x Populus x berolinensis TaxID=444605 RepID=A0AAD6LBE1_9ROSI|nr:hypothetical protein NC653_039428 [Populus alba x Populus x berolinensis]
MAQHFKCHHGRWSLIVGRQCTRRLKSAGASHSLRLLEEDKLVLDRFTTDCFAGTPLHISAMLGHLEFERNISSQTPVFAKELDFRRSSPLHWATANGHLEVVKALLLVNPSCISVLNTTR